MPNTDYSENTLVEQPAIALFGELGYATANCFYEKIGTTNTTLGRETTADVVLAPKLKVALKKLNPNGAYSPNKVMQLRRNIVLPLDVVTSAV